MAMSLRQLLDRLSKEPDLMEQFRSDPYATMSDLGVSEKDQEHVLSQDRDRLAAAVGDEHAEDAGYNFALFFMPGEK